MNVSSCSRVSRLQNLKHRQILPPANNNVVSAVGVVLPAVIAVMIIAVMTVAMRDPMAQTEEAGARKEVVVDVAVVAAALPHGWMSHVKFCGKEGHHAKVCWRRFDEDYEPYEDKEVNAASYGVDTNWYGDTGATHHITSELNNLTIRDNYKVNTASGQDMDITHVGHSIIHHPIQNFHLRNILHVPNASKSLFSVHKFTYDNRVFIEVHPFYFFD
jgi:hypothetical protein